MRKLLRLAAGAAIAVCTAGAASAATVVSPCSPTDISPDAVACSGWYDGNLLNATKIQDQKDALALIGFVWDGDWSAVDATKINPIGDNLYDFAALLNGDTWIGIHKGKGGKDGFESTAFFRLNADNLDTFTLDLKGGSSAVLYQTGGVVPEPATWAMMIIGFGAAGSMVRASRRREAQATA